jgi:tagatose 6-phosphate kinase
MNTVPAQVLTVCLNPAWQKALFFPRLQLGAVNRAARVCASGGGKGINAARALRGVGRPVTVALFAGGHTGELLRAELAAAGCGDLSEVCAAPTRTCTTVVDLASGSVTELIEPSAPVAPEQVNALLARILALLPRLAGVALCGTVPPGVPETFYGEVARAARAAGARVVLDGVTGVGPALDAGVDVLKVNAAELRQLTGRDDLADAARACLGRYRLTWLGVTAGPDAAWLFGPDLAVRYDLPRLEAVRSTIGAGDCATGILLARLAGTDLQRTTVVEAFAAALAAASASCLTDIPALFEPATAARLRAAIRCTDVAARGTAAGQ